ncbi:MAG: SUMF1/EgtB/PvdO family nonheme iron enzyme [Bryobacterales bacterium]|nr:SUMF1/EgtB/PvdO family nonheme iron enzyme [Bryobacterales bacterium]
MARLALLLLALLPAFAQQDEHFKQAGVCGRCHVISVVEWSISSHAKGAADCLACHGKSEGHIIDERNNIKPDKIPHDAAIAGLCADCHKNGCPKTKQTASCQKCHHVHALVNPERPPQVKDQVLEQRAASWERYSRRMEEGERLLKAEHFAQARDAFRAALKENPNDKQAAERLQLCENRLRTGWPGFEIVKERGFCSRTGLPREVRVPALGIRMALVSGGEFEMGSDRFPVSKPRHTVRVAPVYLAVHETTQAEWTALMGKNPSAHQGEKFPEAARLPVEQVSWDDAQAIIRVVNQKVPGAGFRLPTEAEWELAARRGEGSPEPGNLKAPRPVGQGRPDKLGLFDLQGNVWEWCSSLSAPYPYDAADGRESPAAQGMRVLRGGGYADLGDLLDPAMRHAERAGRRLQWNGIRLARGVPQ